MINAVRTFHLMIVNERDKRRERMNETRETRIIS